MYALSDERGDGGGFGRPFFLTRTRRCPISYRTEINNMMVRVVCSCGHTGIASDTLLPCDLRCGRCGSRRRIEAEHCRAIYSTARFEEWIAGERGRPQVRGKAATLATA
jgi:hypothetical protein